MQQIQRTLAFNGRIDPVAEQLAEATSLPPPPLVPPDRQLACEGADPLVLRALNLGAGVQSTVLYLMAADGELAIDVAVFADTGDEPQHVYEHLAWLQTLGGPEIVTVTAGNLGDNLRHGVDSNSGRFVSIPVFLDGGDGRTGMSRRQCTVEYKIKPIETYLRRRLGAAYGERVPDGNRAVQLFGLSFDEPLRVAKVKGRFQGRYWCSAEFPLFDQFLTRTDCLAYLQFRAPDRNVPRSACVYCPYHSDAEWQRIKDSPADWARAVEIDEAIRDEASAAARGLAATQYLHRSCRPLAEVEFRSAPREQQRRIDFSQRDCEGMCGL